MPVSIAITRGPPRLEDHGLGRGYLAREVGARHRRLGHDPLARAVLGEICGEQPATHRPLVADMPHECARVDSGQRRDAAVGQPGEPTALGVGGVLAIDRLAHDHRARVDPIGLHVRPRDPVVTDHRVREDDDLTGVAGVGNRLLVARHGGVENHLARADIGGAHGLPVEAGAVLEQQVGGAHATAPSAKLRSR